MDSEPQEPSGKHKQPSNLVQHNPRGNKVAGSQARLLIRMVRAVSKATPASNRADPHIAQTPVSQDHRGNDNSRRAQQGHRPQPDPE
jgi:hypothetical protein